MKYSKIRVDEILRDVGCIVLGQLKSHQEGITFASVGMVASISGVQLFTSADPLGRCVRFWKQLYSQNKKLTCDSSVNKGIDNYSNLHRGEGSDSSDGRNSQYKELVNTYYDLATVFYEWGWGTCFHFSYRFVQGGSIETFWEAIRRHEYQLVSFLQTTPGQKILDVGCGICGPMRNIARFTLCDVQGITINPYQVTRGNELNAKDPSLAASGVSCESVQGDFMEMPSKNDSFDGAYAIEATCHAPDRTKCYSEILRVLKPGAYFACYEWCMTEKYDPVKHPHHLKLKKDIEEGNGLPDICNTTDCWKALQDAGFEPVYEKDLAEISHGCPDKIQPWYTPLLPSWNPLSQRFQFNPVGGVLTNAAIWTMETIGLAPMGTVKTQKILQSGGFALRDAGDEGVFTAIYLMVGRKPLQTASPQQ